MSEWKIDKIADVHDIQSSGNGDYSEDEQTQSWQPAKIVYTRRSNRLSEKEWNTMKTGNEQPINSKKINERKM